MGTKLPLDSELETQTPPDPGFFGIFHVFPAARPAQAGPAREFAKLFLCRAQAGQGGRPGQKIFLEKY